MADLPHSHTRKELARRWRCRVAVIDAMVRRGELPAITIGGRVRITPEAIAAAERGPLAVRPVRRRVRETVPKEVADLLNT